MDKLSESTLEESKSLSTACITPLILIDHQKRITPLVRFFIQYSEEEDKDKTISDEGDKVVRFNVIPANKRRTYKRWTKEEHCQFLNALIVIGNNWKLATKFIQTRTAIQIRSHAQKYFMKLKEKLEKNKQTLSLTALIQSEFKLYLPLFNDNCLFNDKMEIMIDSLGKYPKCPASEIKAENALQQSSKSEREIIPKATFFNRH